MQNAGFNIPNFAKQAERFYNINIFTEEDKYINTEK
jgi:hypothetical protein